MKNHYLLFIAFSLLSPKLIAQDDYQWGKVFGDVQDDRIVDMQVDSNDNVYLVGEANAYYFDLNPGPGQEIIQNNTINEYGTICFLVKLDPNGNYLWGKVFNPTVRSNSDHIFGLKIGTDNELYTMMHVRRFGNGSLGDDNSVIVKMDLDGNQLMVKDIKNQAQITPGVIEHFDLDSANNFYVSGYFIGTALFDQNNPGLTLTTPGVATFVLKISNQGNYVWSRKAEVSILDHQIKVGPDDNINFVGYEELPPNGVIERLMKINGATGATLWEKDFTQLTPAALTVDHSGNYIIASYRGDSSAPPTDVDPSLTPLFSTAPNLIIWLDPNGNLLDYKEYELNAPFTLLYSDDQNNTYLAKVFGGTFDADPSPNTFNLTAFGSQHGEGLVIKLDPQHNFVNAFKLGQPNIQANPYQNIYGLTFNSIVVKNGYEYYGGSFAGEGDIDPTVGTDIYSTYHDGVSTTDGFAIKIGDCVSAAPQASNQQVFCSGQNPTVNSLLPNSAAMKWYDTATATTPLSTATPLVHNHIYYAARQSGSCPETLRTPVTVTINPTPAAPSAGSQVFCSEVKATLSDIAVTGQNLKWYNTVSDTNALPMSTSLVNGTTYYLTQTTNGCESARVAVPVTIITTAPPVAASPQNFCFPDNKKLSDINVAGQNITWYDAPVTGNVLPAQTVLVDGTTYFATQTDNGCESARTAVTVHIQNTSAPTGNASQTFCAIGNPTLADIIVSGQNISWYANATTTAALPLTTPLQDNVTYYATQTIDNCESVGRLPVTISLIQSLNATAYATTVCDDLNDGVETTDLTLYQDNLIANATTYSFIYYNSLIGAQQQNAAEQVGNVQDYRLVLGDNLFYVNIISPDGCQQIVALTITLVAEPVIDIRDIVPLCEKTSITIDGGSGFDSYAWSTGSHSQSIVVSQTGNYSLTVTENHNNAICSVTKNFTVASSGIATITDIAVADFNGDDNTITINVSGSGSYLYSIDGINYQQGNVFTAVPSGVYTVYVKDKNGCGIAEGEVFVLTYPKFFTPNGDGINDSWSVKYSFTEPGLDTTIFDRYGKLIKNLKPNERWDGTSNGQNLPATDYWFVITRKDGRAYKGHFTLKR